MENFDEMTDQEIIEKNGIQNIDGTLQKMIIGIVRRHKITDDIMYNARKTLAADRADLMRRRRKLQKYPLKKIAADSLVSAYYAEFDDGFDFEAAAKQMETERSAAQ